MTMKMAKDFVSSRDCALMALAATTKDEPFFMTFTKVAFCSDRHL
jgi:hypothetical protein